MATLLLTGDNGFTGRHLRRQAELIGWTVIPLSADLTQHDAVREEVKHLKSIDAVIHLAGISAVTHEDSSALYEVNLFGTLNLLEALAKRSQSLQRIIVSSSANIYGNAKNSPIGESSPAAPLNHYAMSKLAMEYMVRPLADRLPLVVTRPFNYTGRGHDGRFVIPKLVTGFAQRAPVIELGNLDVEREFNDVRTICTAYLALLTHGQAGEVYNLCSGHSIALRTVIDSLVQLTGHQPQIHVNPQFIRASEVHRLAGDPAKLYAAIGPLQHPSIEETLLWMLAGAEN